MLVLTRLIGEKLVIGNEVIIEILAVNGESVKLGVSAPRETSIHRYEVFVEIQAINQAAVAPTSSTFIENFASQLRTHKATEKNSEA